MIRAMTRTALSRLVVLLIAAGLLTACGQKGALYLPDRQPQAVPAPADTPATPAATESRKKPGQE